MEYPDGLTAKQMAKLLDESKSDVMIKDISNELQDKIKLAMKRTADLDVKEVNIKISKKCKWRNC